MSPLRNTISALFLVGWIGCAGCGVKGDPTPYVTGAMLEAEEKAAQAGAVPSPSPTPSATPSPTPKPRKGKAKQR